MANPGMITPDHPDHAKWEGWWLRVTDQTPGSKPDVDAAQKPAVTVHPVANDPDFNDDNEFWDPVKRYWTRIG